MGGLPGDELTGTAREILGKAETAGGSDDPGSLESCKDWLASHLASGGVLAEVASKAAVEAGHSLSTLKRAKAALGIKSKRLHDKWVWLPPLRLLGELATQGGQEGQDAQAVQVDQSSLPMPPPSLENYWLENPRLIAPVSSSAVITRPVPEKVAR